MVDGIAMIILSNDNNIRDALYDTKQSGQDNNI